MKNLFLLFSLVILISITSCNQQPQAYRPYSQPYPQQYQQQGNDVSYGYIDGQPVARVYDNGASYILPMLVYQQMMSNGGYGSVHNYYISHHNEPNFNHYNSRSFQRSSDLTNKYRADYTRQNTTNYNTQPATHTTGTRLKLAPTNNDPAVHTYPMNKPTIAPRSSGPSYTPSRPTYTPTRSTSFGTRSTSSFGSRGGSFGKH